MYWVTQKLPQICAVILRIRTRKVAWFAVYICGNFCVTQYILLAYQEASFQSTSLMFLDQIHQVEIIWTDNIKIQILGDFWKTIIYNDEIF